MTPKPQRSRPVLTKEYGQELTGIISRIYSIQKVRKNKPDPYNILKRVITAYTRSDSHTIM